MSGNTADTTNRRNRLPDIFDYQNYRDYLNDVVVARKNYLRRYSRKQFSKALGFSTHTGLTMILNGQRELQSPYLEKCVKNLKLNVAERLYFEAMIRSGSLSESKRRKLLREVKLLARKWSPPEASDEIRLLDFFIIHQILCLTHIYMDACEIRQLFRYEITDFEINRILDWMLDRQYVVFKSGRYRIQKTVIMSGDETPNAFARKMHKDCFTLAKQSLDNDKLDDREFQTYMFTVDSRRIPEMKSRVKKLVMEVLSEYETELDADTIVQMHFHLFEVIERNKDRLRF